MTFELGQPKHPNSGRRPGTPNKRSAELHHALSGVALEMVPLYQKVLRDLYQEGFSNADFIATLTKLFNLTMPRGVMPILPDPDDDIMPDVDPFIPASISVTHPTTGEIIPVPRGEHPDSYLKRRLMIEADEADDVNDTEIFDNPNNDLEADDDI